MTTPDDLVERVARAVYAHPIDGLDRNAAHQIAITTIRIALEEAAKVADANALEAWDFGADETRGLMRLQAADIAAAIRAMIKEGE